jgi:hypothetical protein
MPLGCYTSICLHCENIFFCGDSVEHFCCENCRKEWEKENKKEWDIKGENNE